MSKLFFLISIVPLKIRCKKNTKSCFLVKLLKILRLPCKVTMDKSISKYTDLLYYFVALAAILKDSLPRGARSITSPQIPKTKWIGSAQEGHTRDSDHSKNNPFHFGEYILTLKSCFFL